MFSPGSLITSNYPAKLGCWGMLLNACGVVVAVVVSIAGVYSMVVIVQHHPWSWETKWGRKRITKGMWQIGMID